VIYEQTGLLMRNFLPLKTYLLSLCSRLPFIPTLPGEAFLKIWKTGFHQNRIAPILKEFKGQFTETEIPATSKPFMKNGDHVESH